MTASRPSNAVLLAAALISIALLPACGRRGPLEPPPGTAERPRQTAAGTQNMSTFAGTTSVRPARETETTLNTLDPNLPATPQQPADIISGNINAPAVTQRSSTLRGGRRSPPPTTPFILDPLL